MKTNIWILIVAEIFSLSVGVYSFRKKSITATGLIALIVISSFFILLNHVDLLFVLFFMYASSSILTKYRKSEKKEFEKVVGKTGARDYMQAIANLGIATLLMLLYHFSTHNIFMIAMIGSVCTANADSWASEIGGLSKSTPVLITTFKPTQKGVSGGITLLGTLGGILGSIFISLIALLFMKLFSTSNSEYFKVFWTTSVSGIIGFLLDSYLGVLLQALFKNDANELTEISSSKNQLVKGIKWINNDMVNLLSTTVGALIAGLLYII
jgi:uncharacterized protein (TIGR00297 family)